jgi:ABC-type dipeptide/oligopeptide/nickel transport system ATPase component
VAQQVSLEQPTETHRLLSAAASVNATLVRKGGVSLHKITLRNNRATSVFLKLYDKATAPSQTDTPRKTIEIPGSTALVDDYVAPMQFSKGLGYRVTTAAADSSTAALTAADITCLAMDYAL